MKRDAEIASKSSKDVAPEKIEISERCPVKKNEQCQCSLTKGHKGSHMGNDQDFLITWED